MTKELEEIKKRSLKAMVNYGGALMEAERDRVVLIDYVEDLLRIQAGLEATITSLQSVLDQYKASITSALSEMEESFAECGEDFMAGTICSLAKGHSGGHGTICHKCGQDWYDQGHALTCPYYQWEDA